MRFLQKLGVADCVMRQIFLPTALGTTTFKDQDFGIEQQLDGFQVTSLERSAKLINNRCGRLCFDWHIL